jgi:predicted DNA-binding transcriptional regulator AlpA
MSNPKNAETSSAPSSSEPDFPRRYMNTEQAAEYISLSTQYMEIARHKGTGPKYVKLAQAVRYRLEDLDSWMESHLRQHTGEV